MTEGAAGLSLRAIARDLGLVSSAVYRYVASRDDLLTLLLVDAYPISPTRSTAPLRRQADNGATSLIAMAREARAWGIDQPARWALLYGSPVPGYQAPAELTLGPGTRVVGAAIRGDRGRHRAGDISMSNVAALQPLSTDFDRLREEFDFAGDDSVLAKCFLLWAGLVGAISLEVFGQYGANTLTEPGACVPHPGPAADRHADRLGMP